MSSQRVEFPSVSKICAHAKHLGFAAAQLIRQETPTPSATAARTIAERGEKLSMDKLRDQDRGKGATEQNPQNQGEGGNTSMQGQLGHRDENAQLKNADSDLSG
jgi:hypothetical protein